MTIKIIEEPVIELTRAQYDAYMREYIHAVSYMVNPPSFEAWVSGRQLQAQILPPFAFGCPI